AKKALEEAGGDFGKAFELLRERGLAQAAKRDDREASEGAIGYYIHVQNDRPVVGVLVELSCETDFVAKSDEFKEAANDIALHVSGGSPRWITRERADREELQKDPARRARRAAAEGEPENVRAYLVEGRLERYSEERLLYDQPLGSPEPFDG